MYFEIHAWHNRTIEVVDLLDIIDLIHVDGNKITCEGKILAEYETSERAEKVFEELLNTFKEGKIDFYYLPEK